MSEKEITIQLSHFVGDKKIATYKLLAGKTYIGGGEECKIHLADYQGKDKLVEIDVSPSGEVKIESLSNDVLLKINDIFTTAGQLKDKDTISIGKEKFIIRIIKGFSIESTKEAKYGYTLEIALFWGDAVLKVMNYNKPKTVYIGDTNRCDFQIPEEVLGVKEYPLITFSGKDFYLNLSHKNLEGRILIGSEIYTIKEFRNQKLIGKDSFLKITPNIKCRLFFNHLSLLIAYTPLEKPVKKSYFRAFDFTAAVFFSISLILHLAFLIIINLIPEEQLIAKRFYYSKENPLLKIIVQENKRKEELLKKKEEEKKKKKKADLKEAKDLEKKSVVEEKLKVDETVVKKKSDELIPSKLTPKQLAERNKQIALNTGATKFFKQQTALISSVLDSGLGDWGGPGSSGVKVIGSIGGAGGNAGIFGGDSAFDPFNGIAGQNSGGGFRGTALSLKTDFGSGILSDLDKKNIATKASAKIKFKGKTVTKLKVFTKAFDKQGNLDKKTIEKIIRRHMPEIKWCYQEELQKNPDLEGKLVVSFTISPTGSILKVKIKSTTMFNKNLESCVISKIKRWRFPEPYGGGVVIVNYPFIFKTVKL